MRKSAKHASTFVKILEAWDGFGALVESVEKMPSPQDYDDYQFDPALRGLPFRLSLTDASRRLFDRRKTEKDAAKTELNRRCDLLNMLSSADEVKRLTKGQQEIREAYSAIQMRARRAGG